MPSIIITGSSGFIGKNISQYLASQGLKVVPVTRANNPEMYHVKNYFDCPAGDILIHLSEESDRSKVNQLGKVYQTESNRLLCTLSNRFERTIYVSSGVVYGDGNQSPNNENTTVKVSDLYSEIKLENEKIVLDSGGTVLRLSNIYGRGMSRNNVVSDILKQIPGRGPVELRDVNPVRDFLHIHDLMPAFLSVLTSSYNGVLNIGSGIGLSINELALIALKIVNEEHRNIVSTTPSRAQSTNILDISKINGLTGWKPTSNIRQNLKYMISEWSNKNNEKA